MLPFIISRVADQNLNPIALCELILNRLQHPNRTLWFTPNKNSSKKSHGQEGKWSLQVQVPFADINDLCPTVLEDHSARVAWGPSKFANFKHKPHNVRHPSSSVVQTRCSLWGLLLFYNKVMPPHWIIKIHRTDRYPYSVRSWKNH